MVLDETWVQLAAGTEALVQRQGDGVIALCYAAATPTTEDSFALGVSLPMIFPIIAGKNLYARAPKGGNVTVEILE